MDEYELTHFRQRYPACLACRHYTKRGQKHTCLAYPIAIPEKFLQIQSPIHVDVEPDQQGNSVFEAKDVEVITPGLPSMSACSGCKHRAATGPGCKAYPRRIPSRWLFTTRMHTTVQVDQVGNYVFEPEEE
ncbi:hypothetical protein GCM10023187_12440 [Nibrella viscosa]|uniref:Uncharacterized protein n=2 Tax=Nibrella viscosa TaxID=1084524 RepID=A0ABP8K415_9BACT